MKKVLSSLLLTTMLLSVFTVVVPVHAQVTPTVATMTVSTTQFWGDALVQVELYDPDMSSVSSSVPIYITINYANGNTYGPVLVYAEESGPSTGDYYLYYANSSSTVTPSGPTAPAPSNIYLYTLSKGDKVVTTYYDALPVGTVEKTVTYAAYITTSKDIFFDRSPDCQNSSASLVQDKNEGTTIPTNTYNRSVLANNLPIKDPLLVGVIEEGKKGAAITINVKVRNVDITSRSFTSILQIKNVSGVTIYINCLFDTLEVNQSSTLNWFWIPPLKGNYTVEIFFVKSISEPIPLSDITFPLTIE